MAAKKFPLSANRLKENENRVSSVPMSWNVGRALENVELGLLPLLMGRSPSYWAMFWTKLLLELGLQKFLDGLDPMLLSGIRKLDIHVNFFPINYLKIKI